MGLHPIHSRSHNAVLLTRVKHKSAPFASTNTVYSIDDRIWLLMLERNIALQQESLQTRKEREETQADESEGDEELHRIHRAIRYATEDLLPLPTPSPSQSQFQSTSSSTLDANHQ